MESNKNKPRIATNVDIYVGERLKRRRKEMKLTQQKLAAKLNISFQQLQKYERATNRISASRLYEIANVLNVTLDYFFKG